MTWWVLWHWLLWLWCCWILLWQQEQGLCLNHPCFCLPWDQLLWKVTDKEVRLSTKNIKNKMKHDFIHFYFEWLSWELWLSSTLMSLCSSSWLQGYGPSIGSSGPPWFACFWMDHGNFLLPQQIMIWFCDIAFLLAKILNFKTWTVCLLIMHDNVVGAS